MQNKDVWLFPQNSCNIAQFFTTLRVIGELNGISRKDNIQNIIMEEQTKNGLYNPYIKKDHFDLSSANHKIDEPRFYGAIYETPNKKFHVSIYGELLLKYENNLMNRNKVFIGMIFNLQFDNPYKKIKNFNIYPIRIIFKLLIEEKLNNTLSNLEISHILYYLKELNAENQYEKIVDKILNFRNIPENNKIKILKQDAKQFIKNYISCNYFLNILSELQIINLNKTKDSFKLKSPVRIKETNITYKFVELKAEYIDFVKKYLEHSSIYENTKKPMGLRSDWIRNIYNSVPSLLLDEIEEKEDVYTEFLQIPKLLIDTSVDSSKWDLFEKYITKSFNLFEDIRAETIGGAGEPDVLCSYLTKQIVFCADGKSTKKKLSSINDGRLKQHREKYNARYTIIVTPGYVPSAVEDIKNTNTCIITSYCFADLITKYIFKLYKNKQECNYKILNDLILKNLGTDVSDKIYNIIDKHIGVSIQH